MAEGNAGEKFKPRPTVYQGIKMRSRLEAGFAQWLDEYEVVWKYEPECFGGPGGQWLPDFWIAQLETESTKDPDDLGPAYVEIRPKPEAPTDEMVRRMLMVWRSEPWVTLLYVTPGAVWQICADNTEGLDPWLERCAWALDTYAVPAITRTLAEGPWFGEWWRG